MTRIRLLNPEDTTGAVKGLLEGVVRKRGYVPTPVQVMAHSSATLSGYMGFASALAGGVLEEAMRERIAIAVAFANDCEPCLVAHSRFAKSAGLSDSEVEAARQFSSAEPRPAAIMSLARAVLESNGHISDEQLAAARATGISDAEVVEIAGHIALNLLTNAANSIAGVKVQAAAD